ncbi:hypothetical protein [Phenylobacterium sp.]|jgi:hypothetical protein|uniref:hypothetical protein n=1 Tax=Phenylobacterium sp. TaxID=1871053 RepID=UPI002F954743
MSRIIAAILALLLGANAVFQLVLPLDWYDAVPGVPATGPFNPHFVRDIGAAYLVAAAGLAWFAWRPREGWPALAAGALFLTLHAAIHVYDAACGTKPLADVTRDFVGVYLVAAVALVLALRRPKET